MYIYYGAHKRFEIKIQNQNHILYFVCIQNIQYTKLLQKCLKYCFISLFYKITEKTLVRILPVPAERHLCTVSLFQGQQISILNLKRRHKFLKFCVKIHSSFTIHMKNFMPSGQSQKENHVNCPTFQIIHLKLNEQVVCIKPA